MSCQTKRDGSSEYVARVDDKYLTPVNIGEAVDTNAAQSSYEIREYVSRWVNLEVLYKEAQRLGYDTDDKLSSMLKDIKRELAVNLLLEKEIYDQKSISVDHGELVKYYDEHRDDFKLREDVINLSYILTKDRNSANEFRRLVEDGTAWVQALERISIDSSVAKNVLISVNSQYAKQSDLPPDEVFRAALSLTPGALSLPISCEAGFYVVALNSVQHEGEIGDFGYAQNEVKERLIIEKKRMLLDDLLKNLKKKHKVEINLGYFGMKDSSRVQAND
jgi:hypothetical protein